jgi:putative hydrolase of HD superfamily
MDKLEMILQAQEYESEGDAGDRGRLDEFFDSTRGRFTTEVGKAWAEEIERRRPANK